MADRDGYIVPTESFTSRAVTDRPARLATVVVLPDVDAPVIENVTPPPGILPGTLAQAKVTPIEFDVVDDREIGVVVVWARIQEGTRQRTLLVHDGEAFLAPFEASERTGSAVEGFHYRLVPPPGGWWGDILELGVLAVDRAGNMGP